MCFKIPFSLSAIPQYVRNVLGAELIERLVPRFPRGPHGRQRTWKSRWALDDYGIMKGKNNTRQRVAREALRSPQEAWITALSPKYAHSLWLSATGDDVLSQGDWSASTTVSVGCQYPAGL